MPRLIHLNGPPGIGKSTIAARYVDDNPGVLNLDIDQLRQLVGGWRDSFAETGALVRPLAMSMAATHLRAGRDVVLPQYLGRLDEIARFESVAHEAQSQFPEFVLMDTRTRSVQRFEQRSESSAHPWHRHVSDVVESGGGSELLGQMHDRLSAVIAARPEAVVIPSRAGAVEATYRRFVAAITAADRSAARSVLRPAPERVHRQRGEDQGEDN